MNKADLIDRIASGAGISKTQAASANIRLRYTFLQTAIRSSNSDSTGLP